MAIRKLVKDSKIRKKIVALPIRKLVTNSKIRKYKVNS